MNYRQASETARCFLLSVSNDESWIDGGNEFVREKLTDLLMKVTEVEESSKERCTGTLVHSEYVLCPVHDHL